MLRQETSFHPKDSREIGNEAVFAGQKSQWPMSRVHPTESAMTCSGTTALGGETQGTGEKHEATGVFPQVSTLNNHTMNTNYRHLK